MADPIDINALADQLDLADGGYVFMIHKSGADVSAKLLPSTVLQDIQAKADAALTEEDVGEAAFLNVEDLPAGGGGGAELDEAVARIVVLEGLVETLMTLVSMEQIPVAEEDLAEEDVFV